jgi:hypothetical protein
LKFFEVSQDNFDLFLTISTIFRNEFNLSDA